MMKTPDSTTIAFIGPIIAMFPAVLWWSGGNLPFALLCASMTAVGVLTLFHPEWSFRFMIGAVLLFDQYRIPGFAPWTHLAGYLNNLKEIDYLPYIHLGMMTPLELHLAMLALAVGIRALAGRGSGPGWRGSGPGWRGSGHGWRGSGRGSTARPGADASPAAPIRPTGMLWIVPFAAWMAVCVARGVAAGGDMMIALWETRALGTFVLVFLITPSLVISPDEWRTVMWIAIGAITVKAAQAIIRFGQLGFSTGGLPTLTSHEDAVFINTLLLFLLSLMAYRSRGAQTGVLMTLAPILLAGFLLSMRRAAYASIMVSAIAFILMQPWDVIRRLALRSLPVLAAAFVYATVGWTIDHPLTMPVQMVKSGIAPEPGNGAASGDEAGERSDDYYSNLYRTIENYNLARTAVEQPLAGTGFGKPYRMDVPLPRISFPLMEFIPHNQILWIYVKTGIVGFTLFWGFFLWMPMRGALAVQRTHDPWSRAFLSLASVSVVNQMVTSFYDLQLTYTRNMVYLAVLMAGIASMQAWQQAQEPAESDEDRMDTMDTAPRMAHQADPSSREVPHGA